MRSSDAVPVIFDLWYQAVVDKVMGRPTMPDHMRQHMCRAMLLAGLRNDRFFDRGHIIRVGHRRWHLGQPLRVAMTAPSLPVPVEVRVGSRSTTQQWKCPVCHRTWRMPMRTDTDIRRKCRCKPPFTFLFGPAAGGGQYLAQTTFIRTEPLPKNA